MHAQVPTVTVAARAVEPYLHLDNRGLVVFDGRRGVLFPAAMLPWVAETIELVLDERRATRHRGDHILGGFVGDDGASATLYAGTADKLASLAVDADGLRRVHDGIRGR